MDSLVTNAAEAKDPQIRESLFRTLLEQKLLPDGPQRGIQEIQSKMKAITLEEIKSFIANERGKGIDWIIAFLLSISKIAKDEQTITEAKEILNEILEPLFFHSPISKIELQFKLCDQLKKKSHKDIHSTVCSFFFLPNPQTVTQQESLDFFASFISFAISVECREAVEGLGFVFRTFHESSPTATQPITAWLFHEQCRLASDISFFRQLAVEVPSLAAVALCDCLPWMLPGASPLSAEALPSVASVAAEWLQQAAPLLAEGSDGPLGSLAPRVIHAAVRAVVLGNLWEGGEDVGNMGTREAQLRVSLRDPLRRCHATVADILFRHSLTSSAGSLTLPDLFPSLKSFAVKFETEDLREAIERWAQLLQISQSPIVQRQQLQSLPLSAFSLTVLRHAVTQ